MALARAVYANPDLVFLDDCFSALDSNTASVVFERLFASDGILRENGTILVTHAIHLLPSVDLILVMQDGKPAFLGSWAELHELEQTSKDIGAVIKQVGLTDNKENGERSSSRRLRRDVTTEKDGVIMTVEEREYGIASLYVWIEWFKNAGGWNYFVWQIMLLCLDRGLYVASDW